MRHHWRKRSRRYWRWWRASIPWYLSLPLSGVTATLLVTALMSARLGNYAAVAAYAFGAGLIAFLVLDAAHSRFLHTRAIRRAERYTLLLMRAIERLEPEPAEEVMDEEAFNRFMRNLWSHP